MSNCLSANQQILNKLQDYLTTHPEIRFCQALQNLDINIKDSCESSCLKDTFYEDPTETLSRLPDFIF